MSDKEPGSEIIIDDTNGTQSEVSEDEILEAEREEIKDETHELVDSEQEEQEEPEEIEEE